MPNSPSETPVFKPDSDSLVNAARALYDLGFNVISVGEGKQSVRGLSGLSRLTLGVGLSLMNWLSGLGGHGSS
jgi:hypothetical protein